VIDMTEFENEFDIDRIILSILEARNTADLDLFMIEYCQIALENVLDKNLIANRTNRVFYLIQRAYNELAHVDKEILLFLKATAIAFTELICEGE
jgi:hypothetical protein